MEGTSDLSPLRPYSSLIDAIYTDGCKQCLDARKNFSNEPLGILRTTLLDIRLHVTDKNVLCIDIIPLDHVSTPSDIRKHTSLFPAIKAVMEQCQHLLLTVFNYHSEVETFGRVSVGNDDNFSHRYYRLLASHSKEAAFTPFNTALYQGEMLHYVVKMLRGLISFSSSSSLESGHKVFLLQKRPGQTV